MALDSDKLRPPLKSPGNLVLCLSALAAVAVAVGLAGAVAVLALQAAGGAFSAGTVLWAAAALSAGGCAGAVLWGLGWLCRNQYEQALAARRAASALERLVGPPAPAGERVPVASVVGPPPAPADGAARGDRLEMLLEQLRELNINVLLTDEQRKDKHHRLMREQTLDLAGRIEQAAAAGDLSAAQGCLERLARLAPDYAGAAQLRERIERARADTEARDVAEAGRRVEDLMAAGGFDQAQAAADALLDRHPSSARAIALVDRVQRERQAMLAERRAGLYGKVEKEAAARRWRAALAAAREFVEAFPDCPEAETVRLQLETLTDNARIEEVRELRDRITDLIDRQRFAEALALARDVVERFPGTAAAAELSKQMSRLAERARGGGGSA